jgi:hypothetical protein
MEVGIDSVRDIVPRLEAPASSESGRTDYPPLTGSATGSDGGETYGGSAREEGQAVPDSSTSVVADRDQVLEQAASESTDELSDEELNRKLTQGERDELKVLCGGVPGDFPSQTKFRELVVLALKESGEWEDRWEADKPPLTVLKVKHGQRIREAIALERGDA